MRKGTAAALLTISTLSLLTSGATLVIVLVGAKRVESEIEEVRTKTNKTISKLKNVLENLEF